MLDTKGEYVISLLSGHLGGANEAARLLADAWQQAVMVGTDVKGSMAVDVLAEKLNCVIADFGDAKDVTALILNNEPVALLNQENCELDGVVLPRNLELVKTADELAKANHYAGVILTSLSSRKPEFYAMPAVR